MKKLIALFMLSGILMFPATTKAQDAADTAAVETTEAVAEPASEPVIVDDEVITEDQRFPPSHQRKVY
jgi:biopolymer transport protein ExbB